MTAPEANKTPEEWDAARRMAEAVNRHVTAANAAGRDRPGWVGIRLEDGRSPDNVLYDTRSDAVRHLSRDPYVFYVKVSRTEMPVREALLILCQCRTAKKRGVTFGREQVIRPMLPEHLMGLVPNAVRASGLILPNRRTRRHPDQHRR